MDQVTLVLTQQDIQVIGEALAAQPLGKSINTFIKLQQQVAQQTQAITPAQVAKEQAEANGAALDPPPKH